MTLPINKLIFRTAVTWFGIGRFYFYYEMASFKLKDLKLRHYAGGQVKMFAYFNTTKIV